MYSENSTTWRSNWFAKCQPSREELSLWAREIFAFRKNHVTGFSLQTWKSPGCVGGGGGCVQLSQGARSGKQKTRKTSQNLFRKRKPILDKGMGGKAPWGCWGGLAALREGCWDSRNNTIKKSKCYLVQRGDLIWKGSAGHTIEEDWWWVGKRDCTCSRKPPSFPNKIRSDSHNSFWGWQS